MSEWSKSMVGDGGPASLGPISQAIRERAERDRRERGMPSGNCGMQTSNPFAAPWKHNGRTADEWLELAAKMESEGKTSHASLMLTCAVICDEEERAMRRLGEEHDDA